MIVRRGGIDAGHRSSGMLFILYSTPSLPVQRRALKRFYVRRVKIAAAIY
jgi:hypothetical protein